MPPFGFWITEVVTSSAAIRGALFETVLTGTIPNGLRIYAASVLVTEVDILC